MKKYFLTSSAVLVLGGLMASCTHDDSDYSSLVESKKIAYQEVFVNAYGKIDPNQTWGFGSVATDAARGLTRAVFTDKWTNNHSCSWESKLNFAKSKDELPVGAIDITDTSYSDQNAANDGAVYYIPSNFNGELNLGYRVKLKAGMTLYNFGTVTSITNVNFDSGISIYNVGTFNFNITSQSHDVYNIGIFKVVNSDGYSHITNLYNGGALVLAGGNEKADIKNSMYIYSNGSATIEMPDGGDMKAVCDIHGILDVTGDVKIQNSTTKYICGIKATGKAENVDGPLITSYVDANEIEFDGNHIYLLPGGHMKAKTTMKFPNSACNVYGHEGSVALIEATNFEFGNKNDFTHNFSNNIYFKVNGGYIDIKGCYDGGDPHHFNNVSEYLNFDNIHNGNLKNDEYDLAADRINAGTASGSPACGKAWSVGGGDDITIPTDKSETTGNEIEVVTTTEYYETIKLKEQGRVFCEDLGQISTNDLDFNDAVFDAYVYEITSSTRIIVTENGKTTSDETTEGTSTYKTAIVLLAAGGTLELKVADKEVHNELGGNPISTIINTITSADEAYHNAYVFSNPVILGTDFDYPSIADIPIWVRYGNGESLLLTAESGWAPHKILVPIGTKWCKERVDIATAYLDFKNYVGSSQNFWEGSINDSKLYTDLTYNKDEIQRTTGTFLINKTKETTYRNEGSTTTGGYEGEPVLSRQLR